MKRVAPPEQLFSITINSKINAYNYKFPIH